MDLRMNYQKIKDICGNGSFKKGESFLRTGNVRLVNLHPGRCEAFVTGVEDFKVQITQNTNGSIHYECSCPKLASYKKECQHVAAVLIMLYESQKTTNLSESIDGSKNILNIFNGGNKQSSFEQNHFENRNIIHANFVCLPSSSRNGMLAIEMLVDNSKVTNIFDFLIGVKDGHRTYVNRSFIFDPNDTCFSKESSEILRLLIQIRQDQLTDEIVMLNKHQLPIPPSYIKKLLKLLSLTSQSRLQYNQMEYKRVELDNKPLQLQFHFMEQNEGNHVLTIKGINTLKVFSSYHLVIWNGRIVELSEEDCDRLEELQRLLNKSQTNEIYIPVEQVPLFINKIIPSLRKFGEVFINSSVLPSDLKTKLIAKLYLDRIKNRLLAALEFHYEDIMINPLDSEEQKLLPFIIRDKEKEDRILAIMDESEFAKTDAGYVLQNEQLEYEFLYHHLSDLQKSVQIYATTAVRNRIFREKTTPKIRIKMKKERTNWLEFKFEMDGIQEQQIRNILIALEEKRKYFRLKNGALMSLETEEFKEIQNFLHSVPKSEVENEDSLSLPLIQGLNYLHSFNSNLIINPEESFREFLQEINNPSNYEVSIPDELNGVLRNYQIIGFKWMKVLAKHKLGGILADDMGLGKTLQSIAFILSEITNVRNEKSPILVVCPSSLTYNWLNELRKFTSNLRVIVLDGPKKNRSELLKSMDEVDIVITSYPVLRRENKWIEEQRFHTVFFDEAQAFKNPYTQTAKMAKKINAQHRFALTGTPIENSLEELWSIFHVIFPSLFGTLKEYSNLQRKTITRRIRPFLLRRTKVDVLTELPEKTEIIDRVDLLTEQKKLYAAYLSKLRHDTLKHLDKDTIRKNKIRILAGLTRLRQICCHPSLFVDGYKGDSAKFIQLFNIIKEALNSGRRILIFSQFTKMLEIIRRKLAIEGIPYFYLDGQTPSQERIERCDRFNAGERDIFLISLKAGGTGLNLTGADTVILYDLWWNPAVESQAADRAYRIGQTKEVQVIKLITKGTIEEKINDLQDKKKHLVDEVIDVENGTNIPQLSEEDIADILGLTLEKKELR